LARGQIAAGRHWTLTFVGYGLTAVCVPALAITPFLAGAGLALACVLILGERLGKAVRSPAKTALLAHAAAAVGLGRGFGVHQALDQIGAVAGPLLVAAVAAAAGTIWPAMAVLIIPGAVAMLLLLRIWRSMGNPITGEEDNTATDATATDATPRRARRGRSVDLCRGDGRRSVRCSWIRLAVRSHERPRPSGPAAADSCCPGSGVCRSPLIAIAGVVLWGAAGGVLDSTVKALVPT
jgi:hypothetical protein